MKNLFLAIFVSSLAINAQAATTPADCAAFANKFVEYAQVRDAGTSMKDALKMATAKEGPNGGFFIESVYRNGEMVHMTPEQIRAMVVKSCMGGKRG